MGTIRRVVGELRDRYALSEHTCSTARWRALRRRGWAGIERSVIYPGCELVGKTIEVGEGAFLNRGVLIDAQNAAVQIGARAHIGHRSMLLTSSHDIGDSAQRAGTLRYGEIHIGEGAWLGAGVTVLPGVTIGAGAVVAAGSVVIHDLPADVVAGGVPARLIRECYTPGQA